MAGKAGREERKNEEGGETDVEGGEEGGRQ